VDAVGDRAGFAVAVDAIIEHRHRHDAAGGARDEDLVGLAQFLDRQRPHLAGDARLTRKLHHRAARHALEDAALGRGDDIVLHCEDVETGAFGDIALAVVEHGDGGVLVIGLEDTHRQVEPVEVLEARIERFRRDSPHRAHHHLQPVAALLVIGDPHEGLREGIEPVLAEPWVAGAGRRHTARAGHLHIGVAQSAPAHAFDQNVCYLRL